MGSDHLLRTFSRLDKRRKTRSVYVAVSGSLHQLIRLALIPALPTLPPPRTNPMKCSHHPARSNASTCSTQWQSQRTRQQIAIHAQRDYEECPWCHKLFSTYRGSSIRHIKPCKAKYNTRAHEEARSRAEQIRTPTPDPYTPVLSEVEIVELGDV